MEKAGASGLMALPAMVYQQDAREAVTHFSTLARATDLPIMIYNNHVAYKVDLSPEDFQGLAGETNIVAVKESSHDSRRMTDMINVLGDRFDLYCGVDDLMLENILFGAVGWVSGMANSFPREAVQMFRHAQAGRVAQALDIYRWFMPLLHLDTAVKLVQYIKLANQMTGEGAEWVRAPRLTLEGEERKRIEAIIQQAIDSRPSLSAAA
jgi:4-hydroxy-tetrahydrodipicolinate synthase